MTVISLFSVTFFSHEAKFFPLHPIAQPPSGGMQFLMSEFSHFTTIADTFSCWGTGCTALLSRLWKTCTNCQGAAAAAELLSQGRQARSWGWPQCRQWLLQQGTVPELRKQGTAVTGKGRVTNQVSVLEILMPWEDWPGAATGQS